MCKKEKTVYFEEFDATQTMVTRSRVITGTDIDLFTSVTHAINPLFLSDDYARAAGQAARLTPAPLQLSLMIGLCYQAGFYDHLVAMVGVDNMKFLTPVHPGETITAEAVLKEKRLTKKPDRGIVVLSHVLKNSRDVVVLAADITYLIRTQAPAS